MKKNCLSSFAYCLGFILLVMFACNVSANDKIAIILDDLGYNLGNDLEALSLGDSITYSILPHTPFGPKLANSAYIQGYEVMLHMPMQPMGDARPGKGVLNNKVTEKEFKRLVRDNIAAIPHVSGLNNHMGSQLTANNGRMIWLMEVLSEYPELYFIDSRTTDKTIAQSTAEKFGVKNSRRNVFLDNHHGDLSLIDKQIDELIQIAHKKGVAVGIGHPYPETIAALKKRLPELKAIGISLVPVSELLNSADESKWLKSANYKDLVKR